MPAQVACAPRVKVRCNNHHTLPAVLLHKTTDVGQLNQRIHRVMRKWNNGFVRDSARFEVLLHQLRNAGVGAKPAPTRDDLRRPSCMVELGGARGAISGEIVVAQNHDHVGSSRRLGRNPEIAGDSEQWGTYQINQETKEHENKENEEFRNNSAALSCILGTRRHRPGSTWRSNAAACSGNKALKYTSLMT